MRFIELTVLEVQELGAGINSDEGHMVNVHNGRSICKRERSHNQDTKETGTWPGLFSL
jgi:hypothetical protein